MFGEGGCLWRTNKGMLFVMFWTSLDAGDDEQTMANA